MPGHIYKTDLLPAYVWMKNDEKSRVFRILVGIPIKNLNFIKIIRKHFEQLMCYQIYFKKEPCCLSMT